MKKKNKQQKDQENAVGSMQYAADKSDGEDVADKLDFEKCGEYLSGWKRALADYENLKADIDKTKASNRDQIRIGLAFDLLPVMDNFDQAVNHAPEDDSIKTWLQGVTFIKKQFEDVFIEMGIEMIDTSIEFDPNLHEAVEEHEDADRSPGEIIEVQSNGWKIGERVLRPAKVTVNKIKKLSS